ANRCAEDEHESVRRRAVTRLMRYYSQTLASTDDQAWVAAEWKNILLTARYAARHELQRQCADLTHAMAGFLDSGGYWGEAIAAHELALAACHGLADARLVARAALDASLANLKTADYGRAEREAAEALTIYVS